MWTCCLTELGKRTFIVPSRGKQMQQLPWKGWYTDPPENARLFPWYRSYCWWFRNPLNSPVEVGSLSHYLQVLLLHPRWVPRFFSINSTINRSKPVCQWSSVSILSKIYPQQKAPSDIGQNTQTQHLPTQKKTQGCGSRANLSPLHFRIPWIKPPGLWEEQIQKVKVLVPSLTTILLMDKILHHQWRMMIIPLFFGISKTSQVVVWDFVHQQ